MEFTYLPHLGKRKEADALILPFWKRKAGIEAAASYEKWIDSLLASLLATGDFKAKEGEVLYLYAEAAIEKRIVLLGLGLQDKVSSETLRRSFGSLTKSCLNKRLRSLNLVMPEFHDEELLRGMIEGLLIPNYIFREQKHKDPEEPFETLLEKITWIGNQRKVSEISPKIAIVIEAVNYARDLTNGSADKITPQYLADCAIRLSKTYSSIQTTILEKKQIEKEKMGLLLAVNRGSSRDPAFIIMRYEGKPKSKDHTVLVGKGVTYDTGGLNLKPVLGGMDSMRCDMAGAAACFGTILAVSRLKLKINVTVAIPATENCIDATSFKPGDVYMSYAGKSVEITNADAEGRLILADAIAYAVKRLNPSRLIDLATLTGAIEIALGSEAAGLLCTNEELAAGLLKSGEATYERLWRMPLFDEYKERLKSDIADLKNWNGRGAGASIGATFIRAFVGEAIPWAHLDIAGTAFSLEAKKYLPKYATGFGVRLLVDFLKKMAH